MKLAEGIIVGISIGLMIATAVWTVDKKSTDPQYKVYKIPAGTFDLDVDIIVTEEAILTVVLRVLI